MEKDLMDKEVLCIIDTRQIQRYMFRSNTFLDTVGGSDLMVHILDDAIRDAMVSIDTPLSEEEYSLFSGSIRGRGKDLSLYSGGCSCGICA